MLTSQLRRVARYVRWRRVLSDRASVSRYLALRTPPTGAPEELTAVRVYVRALGGNPVFLRPGTSDWKVLGETFHGRFHVPPKRLVDASARRILDLGANIGLTAAHFSVLYPEAHVVGVEMDAENAALARINVSPWTGRCDVIESAVWTTDGTVRYVINPGSEYGASIHPHGRNVPSVSLDTLVRDGELIDYLKMDIEGAEKEVLQQRTGWADRVRCMHVETHGSDYGVPECIADLQELGFATSVIRAMRSLRVRETPPWQKRRTPGPVSYDTNDDPVTAPS